MGMTDKQFQAMLLDELENWERVKKLADKEGARETAEMAQTQIDKIHEKSLLANGACEVPYFELFLFL